MPGPRGRWSGWTLPAIPTSATGGRARAVSPGPPRDGSAASHLEGRVAFMQAGPPPFSRTCMVQRVGGDGNYRAPAAAWGRSVSDLQAGGSACSSMKSRRSGRALPPSVAGWGHSLIEGALIERAGAVLRASTGGRAGTSPRIGASLNRMRWIEIRTSSRSAQKPSMGAVPRIRVGCVPPIVSAGAPSGLRRISYRAEEAPATRSRRSRPDDASRTAGSP